MFHSFKDLQSSRFSNQIGPQVDVLNKRVLNQQSEQNNEQCTVCVHHMHTLLRYSTPQHHHTYCLIFLAQASGPKAPVGPCMSMALSTSKTLMRQGSLSPFSHSARRGEKRSTAPWLCSWLPFRESSLQVAQQTSVHNTHTYATSVQMQQCPYTKHTVIMRTIRCFLLVITLDMVHG